jgi:hypothetical protein
MELTDPYFWVLAERMQMMWSCLPSSKLDALLCQRSPVRMFPPDIPVVLLQTGIDRTACLLV